jgi:hypothetical protein
LQSTDQCPPASCVYLEIVSRATHLLFESPCYRECNERLVFPPNLTEPRKGGHVLTDLQLSDSGNVEDVTALALGFVAFAASDGNG